MEDADSAKILHMLHTLGAGREKMASGVDNEMQVSHVPGAALCSLVSLAHAVACSLQGPWRPCFDVSSLLTLEASWCKQHAGCS